MIIITFATAEGYIKPDRQTDRVYMVEERRSKRAREEPTELPSGCKMLTVFRDWGTVRENRTKTENTIAAFTLAKQRRFGLPQTRVVREERGVFAYSLRNSAQRSWREGNVVYARGDLAIALQSQKLSIHFESIHKTAKQKRITIVVYNDCV